MEWCLIGLAATAALLGLGMLIVRPAHLRPPRVRLGLFLRGCVATLCLLGAVALAGLALWAKAMGL